MPHALAFLLPRQIAHSFNAFSISGRQKSGTASSIGKFSPHEGVLNVLIGPDGPTNEGNQRSSLWTQTCKYAVVDLALLPTAPMPIGADSFTFKGLPDASSPLGLFELLFQFEIAESGLEQSMPASGEPSPEATDSDDDAQRSRGQTVSPSPSSVIIPPFPGVVPIHSFEYVLASPLPPQPDGEGKDGVAPGPSRLGQPSVDRRQPVPSLPSAAAVPPMTTLAADAAAPGARSAAPHFSELPGPQLIPEKRSQEPFIRESHSTGRISPDISTPEFSGHPRVRAVTGAEAEAHRDGLTFSLVPARSPVGEPVGPARKDVQVPENPPSGFVDASSAPASERQDSQVHEVLVRPEGAPQRQTSDSGEGSSPSPDSHRERGEERRANTEESAGGVWGGPDTTLAAVPLSETPRRPEDLDIVPPGEPSPAPANSVPEPDELQAATAPGRLASISLQVEDTNGSIVDLRVRSTPERIEMAVSTPDSSLQRDLRRHLPELAAAVERQGYEFVPGGTSSQSSGFGGSSGHHSRPRDQRDPQAQRQKRGESRRFSLTGAQS